MKKKKHIAMFTAHAALLILGVILLGSCIGHVTDQSFLNTVTYIDHVTASINGGERIPVSLPFSFKGLEARTPVTLTADFTADKGESLYIKSVYSPAKIYANGKLIYQFGVQREYPSFMIDPATEVHIIELGNAVTDGRPIKLRMDFLSPAARSTLTVHPPIVGTTKHIIFNLFHRLGVPLMLSIVQMIGGLALVFISLCVIFADKKGSMFIWLGLFSFITGIWSFGENNFTSIVIKNPTLLYLLAFLGLFLFIIPLIRFTRSIVDFKNPQITRWMEFFFAVSAAAACLLQLTGTMAFSASMYFFHALLPPSLLILAILTMIESVKYHNTNARRYVLPITVLALSAVMELFNYRFPFTYVFSSVFQMGIIFFLLFMGVAAALAIKDSIDLKNKRQELAFEKNLMDIQIKEQQTHSLLLSQHEQLLRQQRHDLRHHLNVIQNLTGDSNPDLQNYLQSLINNIPSSSKRFCENMAVNAILCHYEPLCRQKKIELSLSVDIPENNPSISDSSLCIIFGNLLENAVEACDRMKEGRKFIKLASSVQYDILTITMDNSFNGECRVEGGRYKSSKRNEFGIGLSSVQTVAKKEGGTAEFCCKDHLFLSSVYVKR